MNVVPLLGVAFRASHYMVEKSTLPNWIVRIARLNCSTDGALQRANPGCERNMLAQANEKVDMIGQYYVAPNRNVKLRVRTFGEGNKCVVTGPGSKNRPASISATSNEVQGISNVEQTKSLWRARKLGHMPDCSRRSLSDAILVYVWDEARVSQPPSFDYGGQGAKRL